MTHCRDRRYEATREKLVELFEKHHYLVVFLVSAKFEIC